MKRYVILIALAAIVAAGSFALTRRLMPPAEESQMAWMTREFKLTPAQAAGIEKLQAAYQPVCAEHCRLIMAAQARLAVAPADPAAQADLAHLTRKCHDATLQHLRDVAAQMDPGQDRRFLALVEPKLSRHAHQGPLGLK